MENISDITRVAAAVGGASGAGAVIAYVTSRGVIELVKAYLADRAHKRTTQSTHDLGIVPILREDAASQRKELWEEIHALRREVSTVRDDLEAAVARELECERRHSEMSRNFTAQIDALRVDVTEINERRSPSEKAGE